MAGPLFYWWQLNAEAADGEKSAFSSGALIRSSLTTPMAVPRITRGASRPEASP